VVHRLLKWLLQQKSEAGSRGKLKGLPFPGFPAALAEIGEHTSKRERVAMEAERDIVELKKVQFMVGKIGEEFAGVVSGVSGFGFFVELDDLFVEGLVHVSTLEQDYYRFVEEEQALVGERTGARYRIGDTVRVVVAAASPERRQIEFTLAGVIGSASGRTAVEEYKKISVKGKSRKGGGHAVLGRKAENLRMEGAGRVRPPGKVRDKGEGGDEAF
jgi:ribonuclease R